MRRQRRRRLSAAVLFVSTLTLVGCTTQTAAPSAPPEESLAPNQVSALPISDRNIDDAVGKLDGIVKELMDSSGIPGMAVAVVHGGKTIYAKGFGVRDEKTKQPVDADTVFALASMSKPIGSTVVAHQVSAGKVAWDTPVVAHLPWFALADPYVTQNVTIGDMYAHRSGLPDHAGDHLEDLGYSGRQVLERLRFEPLAPFRVTYDYTNFGLTAAAESVAAAADTDWATLSQQQLYEPLGMTSTSSRFSDFEARPDRAVGHQLVDGKWVSRQVREPDAQSPAAGVSSSVNDLTHWLNMLLADGKFNGKQIVSPEALLPAISPQIVSGPSGTPDSRAGFYGYGFNVSTTSGGRQTYSHSGAFELGAATNFVAIPSADLAIVALTNASPIGVPETLTAEFADLVQYGKVRTDWRDAYKHAFADMSKPEGSLVGKTPPPDARPPAPLTSYVGTYNNDYLGPATVTEHNGGLVLALGPVGKTFPLEHWDGDTFTFTLDNENASPGTISRADFSGNELTLEYYNENGTGRFTR